VRLGVVDDAHSHLSYTLVFASHFLHHQLLVGKSSLMKIAMPLFVRSRTSMTARRQTVRSFGRNSVYFDWHDTMSRWRIYINSGHVTLCR
jgi:hypothetical protein